MKAVEIVQTFSIVECASCCIAFAVPSRFETDRRNDHHTFYCPSGHPNQFSAKSREETLRAQLAEQERLRINAEKAATEMRATQKQIASRIANGVCPCCNRTFANLQRHMHTKHSEVKLLVAGKVA